MNLYFSIMNKVIIIASIAIVLLFGCTAVENNTTNNETNNDSNSDDVMTYTLAEVSEHSTADDCWIVINGDVYDVTPYIARGVHPGGEAILDGCGKDATQMFLSTRDGQGHSQGAQNFAKQYIIGKLAQ